MKDKLRPRRSIFTNKRSGPSSTLPQSHVQMLPKLLANCQNFFLIHQPVISRLSIEQLPTCTEPDTSPSSMVPDVVKKLSPVLATLPSVITKTARAQMPTSSHYSEAPLTGEPESKRR